MTSQTLSGPDRVRAWDLPTRLFKWSLVLLVIMAPLAKNFGDVTLAWHKMNGYAILTLLLWRIMWGFSGSTTARFSTFLAWPWTAFGYGLDVLRGRPRRFLGHNPLGGSMVLLLLVFIGLQGLAGLFVSDDIIVEGPLYAYGSPALRRAAQAFHHAAFPMMLGLIAIHVLANLAYTFLKKEPLIQAMVTGDKPAAAYEDAAATEGGSPVLALALLALSIVVVWGGLYWAAGLSAFR
ncbi:cytochrome B [Phreatobacter aquaticus]|uniref:Cytochrome B n=1 Tax=Phreatobacter aquaticus TaxID=2570229 RepID=A0A4D7QLQ2_9HYPH|nr:cytochrome b/b6 domain-containing protein [Phreatobacter aquaticus]QCK88125.1 cytochrome B [Phreatobacter aquaticus]